MTSSTLQKVQEYISRKIATDVAVEDLDPDLNLVSLGIVTSLSLLRVIAWTGDEFNLPVNDLDLDPKQLTSIRAITDFIDSNRP